MQAGIAMQFTREILYYKSKLEPLQQRLLDRDVLLIEKTQPNTIYTPGQTMVVWVAELLNRLPFLSQPQWQVLLTECGEFLLRAGENVSDATNWCYTDAPREKKHVALKQHQLVFVDGRYVTWDTKDTGFLDLHTGETVESLPTPAPMESLSYNLTELARRNLLRFISIEKNKSTES